MRDDGAKKKASRIFKGSVIDTVSPPKDTQSWMLRYVEMS